MTSTPGVVIDLYIETTTDGYKPANAASNHMKNINGKNTFGEINLKGPGAEGEISSVGLSFTFKNRDTNAEVTIPWMQFTLFDFDQNFNDGNRGQEVPPPLRPPANRAHRPASHPNRSAQ